MSEANHKINVTRCAALASTALQNLLAPYHMHIQHIANNEAIPGSFWGDEEAGLIGDTLLVRPDTPVHSALHEACHYICMDRRRREGLHTDAGGGYDEENGVCYLQIILAGHLHGMNQQQMMNDMDAWGYSFRLGSTAEWFKFDAEDAVNWLRQYDLIDAHNQPTWKLRDQESPTHAPDKTEN